MPIERTRVPRTAFAEIVRRDLSTWTAIIADSNDLLAEYQTREADEPGIQYAAHVNKAKAIRKMAEEMQDRTQRILAGMVREEGLLAELNKPD